MLVMCGPLRQCCGSDPGKPIAPELLKAKPPQAALPA